MSTFERIVGGDQEGEKALLVLAGAGLTLYGLTRASWAGAVLTAVGGFLLYHGLKRPAPKFTRPPFTDVPPADSPQADAFLRDALDDIDAVAFPPIPSDGVVSASPHADSPLTEQEHGRAEVQAYFHALERGGGGLPPYDPWHAAEDFRCAAEQVRRRARP